MQIESGYLLQRASSQQIESENFVEREIWVERDTENRYPVKKESN
jgi:hypothetical protein